MTYVTKTEDTHLTHAQKIYDTIASTHDVSEMSIAAHDVAERSDQLDSIEQDYSVEATIYRFLDASALYFTHNDVKVI